MVDDIKVKLGCTKKRVREVIVRVVLEGNLPKFEDITMNVATKIGRSEAFKNRTLPDLFACAESLIDHVQRCSSLTCDLPVRTHFVLASSPEQVRAQEIIEHKRVTDADITRILGESLTSSSALQMSQARNAAEMPTGSHLLEKKMALGGISFPSIESAKDHQASAEYLLQTWIHSIGTEAATERFHHLDVLVRTRCAEAHDETYSPDGPFGSQMLARVRDKLRILATEKNSTYGISYEHLLGFVSIATQECRTWWSNRVDLQKEV